SVCPVHLSPCQIFERMDERRDELAKFHPQDCIGCGCCSYRCPAKLPLAQVVREAGILVQPEEKPVPIERGIKIFKPSNEREEGEL
ncbi:MAG: hypothetical protein R3Y07_03740, partial [Eubacteriales bacterium]